VLLGATGNLAEKYLWQGMYNIFREGLDTGDAIQITPAATKNAEQSVPRLEKILNEKVKAEDDASFQAFRSCVSDFTQLRSEDQYEQLGKDLEAALERDGVAESGRLLYLSVPPKFFGAIAVNINKYLRSKTKGAWLRVIIEKPFGVDLVSAEKLAQDLFVSLREEEILLVDHYMGKSVMQGMRDLAGAGQFQTFLENPTGAIERGESPEVEQESKIPGTAKEASKQGEKACEMELGMLEEDDCQGRTDFYDEVGVIRDTMQNHLMMMLALIGMDPATSSKGPESIARKAFFEKLSSASLAGTKSLAQYQSYNEHIRADRERWGQSPPERSSKTPSFAHVTLQVNHPKHFLGGIPLHFVSGKALENRRSYVDIHVNGVRSLVCNLQGKSPVQESGEFIYATPDTGVDFTALETNGWVVKERDDGAKVAFAPSAPFAYQVLLRAGLEGHKEHFVSLDEVLESWRVWSPLLSEMGETGDDLSVSQYPTSWNHVGANVQA